MALGVQYAHGAAARADLERVRDARYIGGVRDGIRAEDDAALGVLNRLVREVSVGINQVVVNQENLALLSGVPFTRPSTPPSPIYYGVTDPTVSDTTDIDYQEGWPLCDRGHYALNRGLGGRYHRRSSLFARGSGSRDSSPSPSRVVSSSGTPDSLPELIGCNTRDAIGDVDSDFDPSSQSFFKSCETRRWVERQEQEAVALFSSGLCSSGSCSTSADAGEEAPSSTDRGEWESPLGVGDLEVSARSGAGDLGPRCVGMSGLRVSPSDDDVELLLVFWLSSRPPQSPVLE